MLSENNTHAPTLMHHRARAHTHTHTHTHSLTHSSVPTPHEFTASAYILIIMDLIAHRWGEETPDVLTAGTLIHTHTDTHTHTHTLTHPHMLSHNHSSSLVQRGHTLDTYTHIHGRKVQICFLKGNHAKWQATLHIFTAHAMCSYTPTHTHDLSNIHNFNTKHTHAFTMTRHPHTRQEG